MAAAHLGLSAEEQEVQGGKGLLEECQVLPLTPPSTEQGSISLTLHVPTAILPPHLHSGIFPRLDYFLVSLNPALLLDPPPVSPCQ